MFPESVIVVNTDTFDDLDFLPLIQRQTMLASTTSQPPSSLPAAEQKPLVVREEKRKRSRKEKRGREECGRHYAKVSTANTDNDYLDFMPLSDRRRMLLSRTCRGPTRCPPVKRISPGFPQKWPGLPRGVKFDPTDAELLCHLLDKVGKGDTQPHPFISEFINCLDEDDGFGYLHPHKLPGVKQDGSVSYYFHRPLKAYGSRSRKRKKINVDDYDFVRWHKIGKTEPVYIDGIHQGCKRLMNLYMHSAKHEKPEKTNWVMHQYHVGTTEDGEGEFVVSKIFCHLKPRRCEKAARDLSLDTGESVGIKVEPEVARKSIAPEPYNLHHSLTSTESSIQVTFHETGVEENSTHSAWRRPNDYDSLPAEASKQGEIHPQCLIDSQQQGDNLLSCHEILQRQSSRGTGVETSRSCIFDNALLGDSGLKKDMMDSGSDLMVGDYESKDARLSERNYCNMAAEVEASHRTPDVQPSTSNLYLIPSLKIEGHTSGQRGSDFNTNNLLEHSAQLDLAANIKVEESDCTQKVSCTESVDNISHVDYGASTLLCEVERDELDDISLQERAKLLLSSIRHALGHSSDLKSGQTCRQFSLKPGSCSPEHGEHSEVISKRDKPGTPMSPFEAISEPNVSGLQDASLRPSDNSMNNISEFITVKVKDEILPADIPLPLEQCFDRIEHDAPKSVASPLSESLDTVVDGSLPADGQSSQNPPYFLNDVSLRASHTQENQGSRDVLTCQAFGQGVKLPILRETCRHANAKSQAQRKAFSTFLVQVKAGSSDDIDDNNTKEANVAMQYSKDTSCSSDKGAAEYSTVPCTSEARFCPDYCLHISCRSQQNEEYSNRASDKACISKFGLSRPVQSLVNQNKHHLSNSCLSIFPLEVKSEPLEENKTDSIPEENAEELPCSSLYGHPTERLHPATPCSSKVNPHDNLLSEHISASCILSCQASLRKDVHLNSSDAELLCPKKSSSQDIVVSKNTCIITQIPEKDANFKENIISNDSTLQEEAGSLCFDEAYLQANKEHSNQVLSSSLLGPKLECLEGGSQHILSSMQKFDMLRTEVKWECSDELTKDVIDHIPSGEVFEMPVSAGVFNTSRDNNTECSQQTNPHPLECGSSDSVNVKASCYSLRRKRKRKKTATDSVETALEEDAPGLLQVLLDKGITAEEIKLYGDMEDDEALPDSSTEDSFEELETLMPKLFPQGPSLFKFPSIRQIKGSKPVYCLACLISLIEQARYLRFRNRPAEWGWCRDLQSFIFIFETHNRIVLERPEYGYATYFFELVGSLPIDWQIRRLVTAMKLSCCSRSILLENKSLLVGEDLTEGEARILEGYGWIRNSGLGTMLNYCERVVHDKKNERYSSEWRAKIGKILMRGHDNGRTVLSSLPKKATEYVEYHSTEIKLEREDSFTHSVAPIIDGY